MDGYIYALKSGLEVKDIIEEGDDKYEILAVEAMVKEEEDDEWREATVEELETITEELGEVCYEQWLENQICRAELGR